MKSGGIAFGKPTRAMWSAALLVSTTLAGALAGAGPARAQSTQEHRFEIPAGPLAAALISFGRQSGLQVSVPAGLAEGRRSHAVSGTMTDPDALSRLLSGTGLTFRISGRTVTLAPAPQAGEGAVQLGAVRVEGGGTSGATGILSDVLTSDAAATEGTGSYTTTTMNSATGLALSIRETPQTVTVVTREKIDDQAMINLADVIEDTPGLTLNASNGPSRPLFYARGFYVNKVTYDGASSIWSSYIPTSLANMAMFDRVEIVRGAAGLMKGADNPSAAINMVRKRPTMDFKGYGELRLGSWNDLAGTIDLGGKLNESGSLRARGVGFKQTADSFRDGNHYNRQLFYGILEADIDSDTMLTVGAYDQKDKTDGAWWGGLPVPQTGGHYAFDRSDSLATDWEYMNQDQTSVFGELEHHFAGDWKAKLVAMQTWMTIDALGTYVRTTYDDAGEGTNRHYYWLGDQTYKNTNVDLRADGSFHFLGGEHQLVTGLSYLRSNSKTTNYQAGYLEDSFDIFDWDPTSVAQPDLPVSGNSHSVTSQTGAFATVRLSLLEPVTLMLGGRFDWYDYDNRSGSSDYKINAHFTKYAGLVYDFETHHSLYASYTDVFQPQSRVDTEGDILQPIVGTNYEVGVKGEYFGGALNASAALFLIEQSNRATVVEDVTTCTTASTCYEPAGLVRSKGIDTEVQGALTPNWQISLGYTYTNVEYVDDPSYAKGTAFDPSLPEHLVKLSSTYTIPSVLDGLKLGGSLRWQSRTYEEATVNDVDYYTAQGAYALVDINAGLAVNPNVDVRLNVNNLFDKTYYAALGYHPLWGSMESFGAPRSVIATLRVKI